MNPLVIIVVLNWNLPAETGECVASLLAGDYARQRVLVVDNGSTDDSVPQLRRRFDDQIAILETGANLFFAAGNNAGVRWALDAGADLILILNNDTRVAPDMVSRLVLTALTRPDVGILAPMIYFDHDRSRIWALGSQRRRWWPMPRDVGRGEIDRGQYTAPFVVDYVTGCAMMARQSVFTQVGLFDPRYQMYYEDADLCARAQRAGFRLLVEPRAKMWHMVSTSAGRQAATSRYQRTRYRVRFYRQHSHGISSWLTLALLWAQEVARLGITLKRGQRDLVAAGWRGLWDGYREEVDRLYESH
jgi:GT2 family glycosyltransferase